MRKHIGKALKACSQAIQTALSQYNAAAATLSPPRPPLQWDRVVEYAFLADSDLLQDVRPDMSGHRWATPAGCQAMDMYFKICRAREEIKHLNIEIQRVITYMHIEDAHLCRHEAMVAVIDPALALALQISVYCNSREHFYAAHMRQFYALSKDASFTGNISLGVVVPCNGFGLEEPDDDVMNVDSEYVGLGGNTEGESDDSDEEEAEETVFEEVQAIIQVLEDNERQ